MDQDHLSALIAKTAVAGVPSKSVAYGLANCWG